MLGQLTAAKTPTQQMMETFPMFMMMTMMTAMVGGV